MLYMVELNHSSFLEKDTALMVFPKEESSTFSHATTTELPAPVALFSFPKTHPLTYFPVRGGYKHKLSYHIRPVHSSGHELFE
jgi:hypothetical protein